MTLESREAPRLAVLIDAENIGSGRVEPLFQEIAKLGRATTKRIYGDWTRPDMGPWRDVLHERALVPIQQFRLSKGKNCVDCALIVDAMDLLYTGRFDGFCLASSDGDFTRLASRLRESGLLVYGFGEAKTPEGFIKTCDRFFVLDPPPTPAPAANGTAPKPTPTPKPAAAPSTNGVAPKPVAAPKPAAAPSTNGVAPVPAVTFGKAHRELMRAAYLAGGGKDGWVDMAFLGGELRRLSPSFDSRAFGFAKLGDLLKSIGLFEMRQMPSQKNPACAIWRVKWAEKLKEARAAASA